MGQPAFSQAQRGGWAARGGACSMAGAEVREPVPWPGSAYTQAQSRIPRALRPAVRAQEQANGRMAPIPPSQTKLVARTQGKESWPHQVGDLTFETSEPWVQRSLSIDEVVSDQAPNVPGPRTTGVRLPYWDWGMEASEAGPTEASPCCGIAASGKHKGGAGMSLARVGAKVPKGTCRWTDGRWLWDQAAFRAARGISTLSHSAPPSTLEP